MRLLRQERSALTTRRSSLARADAAVKLKAEGGAAAPAFAQVIGNLSQLIVAVDSADAAPTTQEQQAAEKTLAQAQALLKQWEALKNK